MCLLSRGETSVSNYSLSMRLERITAHVQLLHLLSNRCTGEETCFRQASFKPGIIDTHTPFAILFGDNHYVGQPFRVLNLSNETSIKEFVNFLFYDFSTYWMKLPQFLSYQFILFWKVQMMLSQSGRNDRHIGMGPCEDVKELLQK